MSFFQTVSNWLLGQYKVRGSQMTDESVVQHVRLDIGSGTAESQITSANPLPTSVTGAVPLPTGAATEAKQDAQIAQIGELSSSDGGGLPNNALMIGGNDGSGLRFISVDGSGQLGLQIQNNEDAPAVSGGVGVPPLSVRQDTLASSTSADGDFQHLKSDSSGRLHTIDNRTSSSSQHVQGYTPVGGAISPGNVFPTAFTDLFGNAIVPTGLNASGVIVMGVLPLDAGLNLQSFRNTGECFALAAATANSTATARFLECDANGRLGQQSEVLPSTVTFSRPSCTTATSTNVLSANTSRKRGAYLQNNTTATFWIKEGATAVTNEGAQLAPGGVYNIVSTAQINAIQSSGGSLNLDVCEVS